jgi:probable rRNA maturation factor
LFKKLIKMILRAEHAQGIINLVFIGDEEIRKLNHQYRKKDKATDVLAFPMGEDGILGDIAISTETAKRNAKRFGVIYKEELKRLVIHGVLHVIGYDHGPKMRAKEKEYSRIAHAQEIYKKH